MEKIYNDKNKHEMAKIFRQLSQDIAEFFLNFQNYCNLVEIYSFSDFLKFLYFILSDNGEFFFLSVRQIYERFFFTLVTEKAYIELMRRLLRATINKLDE